MNTRDKILQKARKTKKESDWSNYKRQKGLCNNKVKQAKQKYHRNLLTKKSRSPKKFLKCIKETFPTKETALVAATASTKVVENRVTRTLF